MCSSWKLEHIRGIVLIRKIRTSWKLEHISSCVPKSKVASGK